MHQTTRRLTDNLNRNKGTMGIEAIFRCIDKLVYIMKRKKTGQEFPLP
jgi:hypothetical protein